MTPKPVKKVQLYDDHREKHRFPLFNDKEVGIPLQYQNVVMETVTLFIFSGTMMTRKLTPLKWKEV